MSKLKCFINFSFNKKSLNLQKKRTLNTKYLKAQRGKGEGGGGKAEKRRGKLPTSSAIMEFNPLIVNQEILTSFRASGNVREKSQCDFVSEKCDF